MQNVIFTLTFCSLSLALIEIKIFFNILPISSTIEMSSAAEHHNHLHYVRHQQEAFD